MDPKYIAGSLKRESCKVLLKEFNKEPAAGRASYSSSCALWDLTQGSGDPSLIKIQYTWSTMFSLMKYTAIILKKYTSSILSVYLEYTSVHLGKLHGVYFKYYIFRTIKYTLNILLFFVLISILEVYLSAYCLSLFSSVYLKYISVHTAFLCSHKYTWSILQCMHANANKTAVYLYLTKHAVWTRLESIVKYTPKCSSMCDFTLHVDSCNSSV